MPEENHSRHFDEMWIAFEDWRDSRGLSELGPALEEFACERQLDRSTLDRLRDFVQLERTLRGISSGSDGPSNIQPQVVGNYRLVKMIGSGGMGSVWLAEQFGPVQRQVAIKLIRAGLDGGQFLARFDIERQSLAMMCHPNIAQIFDAGSTDAQRPYMVMEYVPGIPLNEWCDQHQSSVQDRLRLFLQVCAAIRHSHQKGILHRDLKPSNLLVTLLDGQPTVKVIDFGLAKILGTPATGQSGLTQNLVAVGTPLWMSPEQLALGAHVDTRSDVFSLGCVLYQLMTGETPLAPSSIELADLIELAARVRRQVCQAPSTRVRTSEDAQRWVQKCTGSSPALHAAGLEQDLDWIVLKALRAEVGERYQDVNELAADVGRHLDGEPVLARPASFAYRLRKFVRRHRLVSGLVLAVVLAIVGSAIAASGLAVWAMRERTTANQSQQQLAMALRDVKALAEEESRVIDSIIRAFGFASPWRQGAERFRSLDDFYLAFSAEMEDWEPTSDRQVEKRLRTEIAQGLYGLGRKDLAALEWEKVVRLIENSSEGTRELTVAQLDHAQALLGIGSTKQARDLIERCARQLPQKVEDDLELALKYDLVNAELAGRENDFWSMYEISTKALGAAHGKFGLEHRVIRDLHTSLVNACLNLRKFEEALTKTNQAREFCDRELGPDSLVSMQFHCFQLIAQAHLRDPSFSRDEALELVARANVKLGLAHPSLFFFRNGVAAALRESGHFSDALTLNQLNLQLAEQGPLSQDSQLVPYLVDLGVTLKKMERFGDSIPYWLRAIEIATADGGSTHPLAVQSNGEIAEVYLRLQEPENALVHARRALSNLDSTAFFDSSGNSTANTQLREFLSNIVVESELALRTREKNK